MKINTLTIARLQNSDHVNFMKFTAEATVRFAVIGESFPTQVAYFKSCYDRENQAYLKSNRSFLTKKVQAANELRILRFREVNNVLKGAELCTEEGKAEAAKFLLSIIRDYGGASKILALRVDSLSGVLSNLVEDFQERFAAQVSAAGLTECVEELRVANDEYIRLRGDRTEEVSQQEKEEMVNARGACDTAWHGLIDSVNWQYFYFKNTDYLPFMRYMNTEIDWYRTILGQKPGDANTNPDGGSEEDGETVPPTETEPTNPGGSGETDSPGAGSPSNPGAGDDNSGAGGDNSGSTEPSEPLYTIAWYDKSTPIQWYELPAGAAVPEAPEPPEGHRWAQTFTVMPARDVDIVAVAI